MECHNTNVCCDILKSRNNSLGKYVQLAQSQIVEIIWLIYIMMQDYVLLMSQMRIVRCLEGLVAKYWIPSNI